MSSSSSSGAAGTSLGKRKDCPADEKDGGAEKKARVDESATTVTAPKLSVLAAKEIVFVAAALNAVLKGRPLAASTTDQTRDAEQLRTAAGIGLHTLASSAGDLSAAFAERTMTAEQTVRYVTRVLQHLAPEEHWQPDAAPAELAVLRELSRCANSLPALKTYVVDAHYRGLEASFEVEARSELLAMFQVQRTRRADIAKQLQIHPSRVQIIDHYADWLTQHYLFSATLKKAKYRRYDDHICLGLLVFGCNALGAVESDSVNDGDSELSYACTSAAYVNLK